MECTFKKILYLWNLKIVTCPFFPLVCFPSVMYHTVSQDLDSAMAVVEDEPVSAADTSHLHPLCRHHAGRGERDTHEARASYPWHRDSIPSH